MKSSIRNWGQSSKILAHLQDYPVKVITATYFMWWMKVLWWKSIEWPFVGYSASARLSELKSLGLVDKVGETLEDWDKKNRNLYRISAKWIDYLIWTKINPVTEVKITKNTPPLDFERVQEVKNIINTNKNTNLFYLFMKKLWNILKI